MFFLSHSAALLALLFYFFGAFFALKALFVNKPSKLKISPRKFLIVGAACHFFFLLGSLDEYRSFAFISSFISLNLFSFYLVLTSFLNFNKKYKFEILDAFVSPLAIFFFLLASFVFHKETSLNLSSEQQFVQSLLPNFSQGFYLLEIHLALMTFALFSFSMLTIFSIVLIFKSEMLKRNLWHRLSRNLPAISRIETINSFFLNSGCLMLFLGLVSGFQLMVSNFNSLMPVNSSENLINLFLNDPLLLASVLVFISYSTLIILKQSTGLRGKRAALLSCCFYLLILIPFSFFQDFHVYR